MIKYFQFLLLFITVTVSAQEVGTISGTLTDKDYNNEPLPFANVILKGTTKGTTTDFDGNYTIDNVPVGTYVVEFSFIGYETVEKTDIIVETNKTTTLNVALGASAAALDEVFIEATVRRESEAALLTEQN